MDKNPLYFLMNICLLILVLHRCNSPNEPDDNAPPSVKIISPLNNSVVSGFVTIICVAKNNKGIEKLELWINGKTTEIVDNSQPFTDRQYLLT